MKHSASAGAIMIGPNDKVVVVSQHGTSWSLVKGTVEEGESLENTLRREVKEETGITKFEIIKHYPSYDRFLIGKKRRGRQELSKDDKYFPVCEPGT